MPDRPALELLPAVDVSGGRAVGLVRAEEASEVPHGDPVKAALRWQEAGADWIHLVDIDAAFGRGSNRELLTRVIRAVDVRVELSGGIRDEESLTAALATGCARANLGTEALRDLPWVDSAIGRHGQRLAVCLDVRRHTLAPRGTTEDGGELWPALAHLDAQGSARYVVTDVLRDGAMTGTNLDLLREVCARTSRPVIASGGVSTLDDIAELRSLVDAGVEGAIVGKALYAGAFTLEQALDVARG